MKKHLNPAVVIVVIIFVKDTMIVGMKLLDYNYDILTEVYVAGSCWLVVCGNAVYTAVKGLLKSEPAIMVNT